MDLEIKPYRQGDVWLFPVERIPGPDFNRIRIPAVRGQGHILAQGEATGHHHRIRTKGTKLVRIGGERYVDVPKGGAELTHEEHETITLPQGKYKVGGQREYVAPTRQNTRSSERRVWD